MMTWPLIIAAALGIGTVFQAGINKQISTQTGLPSAVLLNALILLFAALLTVFITENSTEDFKTLITQLKWQYFLPGLIGFSVVIGLPFALKNESAVKVFLFFLTFQTITSFVWDIYQTGQTPNIKTLAGALLSLIGIAVMML